MILVQVIILLFANLAFGEYCPSRCQCANNGSIYCIKQNLTSKDIEMMTFPINATMLNLTENLLTYFPTKIFRYHTKLKTIELRKNFLDSLPLNLGSEIPSLNIIHLNNNKIKELKNNSFDGFDKIITLDLSGNLLKKIPANVFKKCTNLLYLNLNHNQIDKINDQSFATLKYLRKLSLSVNKISSLAPGSFNGLFSIEVIQLDTNNISIIAEGLFSTLNKLIELRLANNNIDRVLPKAFQSQKFNVLDLSQNNIKTLLMDSFFEVESKSLMLNNNPIVCDCTLSLRVDRLQVTGLCQVPADLKDTPLEKALSNNYLNCTVCSINPCQNAGKCVLQSKPDTYICVCEPMYKGINCTTKKKGCELNPCLNNATCSDGNSTEKYVCSCTSNYTGNCENLKVCLSKPCHNNGICQENVSQEKNRCKCQTGFYGTFCKKKSFSPGWIAFIVISITLTIAGSTLYIRKFRSQKGNLLEKSPLVTKTLL